jgi:thiol-disulfide isomerase/thioredoxin
MKYIFLLFVLLWASVGHAQTNIPAVNLKTPDGKTVSSSTFKNDGKPLVINFWATWCKPCVKELTTIHDLYEKWQEETGVKIIAISIDDARNSSKVGPFVNSKGWDYEVYIDENSDFKRAMNVANVPHTFLLDGKGNIVWQHNNYLPGDENELFKQIKNLTATGK